MGTGAGRMLVWSVVLGFGVAAAGGSVRLDPGEGAVSATPAMSDGVLSVALRIAPGAQAPLRPMVGEYRLSVLSGELTVVMRSATETIRSGETRVIPAGMDFQLLNRGAETAEVRVSLSLAGLDFPLAYPAQGQA